MAEKVKDGINGLHFVARDPRSLARTLERAVASPELWNSLRRGIPSVYRMDDHASDTRAEAASLDLEIERNPGQVPQQNILRLPVECLPRRTSWR